MKRSTLFLGAVLFAPPVLAPAAHAQEDESLLSASDLPPPTFEVQRLPPDVSYEFAMHFSFGTVTYWREFVDAWIGFGGRFSGGKHFNDHRLGGALTFVAEGPLGVHTTLALEPHATWDYVAPKSGLALGFGIGPAAMYHFRNDISEPERTFTLNPSAAARIGWSQSWTRVGRRLFIVAEPKIRYIDGEPNPLVAVVVGSGSGR